MLLRRLCQVSLPIGLLVVAACGDIEPSVRTVGPSPVETAKHPPPTVPAPDVRAALLAIAHVIGAISPETSVPAATAPHSAAPAIPTSVVESPQPVSYLPCGGVEYPPCSVVEIESGGDYDAYNPTGCNGHGCFGRWQFSGEWACRLGLPCDLSTASPAQQDAAARALWAGGAGCSNWDACG